MPTVAQYIGCIERADRIMKEKAEGLTHADSMLQLSVPSNNMNWILGHILVYREQYLGVIDGKSEPDSAEFAIYGYGSDALTDSAKAMPLETIMSRLDAASAKLISALNAMPAGKLDEIFDAEAGTTVDDRLLGYCIYHENYHVGQLEVPRELALANK